MAVRKYPIHYAPKPGKGGSLTEVVVMGNHGDDGTLVLDVSALFAGPRVLNACRKGAGTAVWFWQMFAMGAFIASVVLAFTWHWWAVVGGMVLAAVVHTHNKQAAIEFAMQALANGKGSSALSSAGALFFTPAESILTSAKRPQ